VPLQGLVIRDTYPDHVAYQCLVTTDLTLSPPQLHQYSRDRWNIEESFMDLTRYWTLDHVGPCRPAVARALIHFLLLAYTLLHLFAHETGPLPEPPAAPADPAAPSATQRPAHANPACRALSCCRAGRSRSTTATTTPSCYPANWSPLILDHIEAWQRNREPLLAALRCCEGLSPPPRAPD